LDDKELTCSNRLEKKGPFGDDGPQTSNLAELRAVIAALRFRFWPGEGFRTFVVAADSEYVVEGATTWARNRDLWEALLGEAERYEKDGMKIEFWRIPRALNERADAAANKAAGETNVPAQWADVMGINV
jgi:ribonuclease HI